MTTYTNLGIKEITTGDESGTWGTSTNTNFEYFDAAIVGYKKVTLTNAGTSGSPNVLNIANFAASDGRNRVIEYYSASDLGATCYVQITPNTFVGYYFIRNSLGGSRDLVVFQGTYSAPNAITLANGKDYIIRCDGAGSGAVVSQVLNNPAFNSISLATAIPAGSGGTGQTSYTTGDLLYASGTTALSKLALGTTNYVLTAGASAPQYTAQSALAVGRATNLAGGVASQIPYQTGANTTAFISNGTAGQVLISAGTSAPAWNGINGGTF